MLSASNVAMIVAAGAFAIWAAIPPKSVALDDDCKPDGVRAHFSALVTGNWFWRTQAAAIDAEQLTILAIQNKGGADVNKVNPIEERMDRLSGHEQQQKSEDEKYAFHAQRQSERMEQLGWLIKCAKVADRRQN